MAEPLKNAFGPDIPQRIADMMVAVDPTFDRAAFIHAALDGYDELELTARAKHVSHALATVLPSDREATIGRLIEALGAPFESSALSGMDSFLYLPFVYFVAEYGLDHFEISMTAQYELTQRFTAEFSLRFFIERYPERSFERLTVWAKDPNVHVRRLVSEGTRSRLPWAPRLRLVQDDPEPVFVLLEMLKDDPEEYVRRSVANNLNDIAKDHPERVVEVARRWWSDASPERKKLVRHGLRTLVKAGHRGALDVLGFGGVSPLELESFTCSPPRVAIGGSVRLEAHFRNPTDRPARGLVDFRIHFVKASGESSPKVFKGGELDVGSHEPARLRKTISIRQHTTRKHYPGLHRVDVLINGRSHPVEGFEVVAATDAAG